MRRARVWGLWAASLVVMAAPAQAEGPFLIQEVRTNFVPYQDFVGA